MEAVKRYGWNLLIALDQLANDGAVLDVVLRKAEEIRKATGITVPLPDERGPVTDALIGETAQHDVGRHVCLLMSVARSG